MQEDGLKMTYSVIHKSNHETKILVKRWMDGWMDAKNILRELEEITQN